MTKTKGSRQKPHKTAKKGRKRGPKEERLVITEDPSVALQRLLNPPQPRKTKPEPTE